MVSGMAPTPSVVVQKSFVYRGGTQLWSNRYHFAGGTPADLAHWNTLFDAIVLAEKACLRGSSTIVKCSGYAAGATVAAASKSYTTAGTLSTTGGVLQAGDVCALLRWSTAALTSKNHPVYLFSYIHDVCTGTTDRDTLLAGEKTAIETYGTAWLTGFSDGTNTYTRAGPNGAAAVARFVNPLVTHRDFPR